MTIQEIQDEIIEEFDMFDDWMQKYDYLIELSKDLPLLDEKHKLDENIIKGCQSKVWLHAEKTRRQRALYCRQRRHNNQRNCGLIGARIRPAKEQRHTRKRAALY